MRIAMVVAGAGAMYCGACTRDGYLAQALREAGHEVSVFPIYTPLRLEEDPGVEQHPLHIGGISAFLTEKCPRLARAMSPAKRVLDSPGLLNWASRFAVRTQAADLGQLTVSFLQGASGPHLTEIGALAQDVASARPEAIVLANSLLAGLIGPLTHATGAPAVCQVQGEDGFLDELPEPWRSKAADLIRQSVGDASAFMAPCSAHALDMAERLQQPLTRFTVVPPVVKPCVGRPVREYRSVVRLGHLSSVRRAKGLDLLLGAVANLSGIEVAVRGKVIEPDFFKAVRSMTGSMKVEFGGELEPEAKQSFLVNCDFIVLPSRLRESRGIVALESLAAGVPVIAPARGIFPEIAAVSGGVALYEADEELEATIRECVGERDMWKARGLAASGAVVRHYSLGQCALAAEACLRR
jgi:glycosyltransferase involved in cell wall biosynthesis